MGSLDGVGIVLFVLFAITITAMYMLIRRRLAAVSVAAIVGTVINVVLVTLISLAAGNQPVQAIVVGLVVGVLFSSASAAMAAYFANAGASPKRRASSVRRPPTTKDHAADREG